MDSRARKLAELVERYYALLYRYAYRLSGSEADAEDLTQQTFLTAQAKWDQLRSEDCAKSWLFAIARNAYLKQFRGPLSISVGGLEELTVEPAHAGDSTDAVDTEHLQNLLNDLPEEFRSPLILYYFENFSYKEIAEQMQAPLGTVMSRLSRAKAWLRRRLTPHEMAGASTAADEQLL